MKYLIQAVLLLFISASLSAQTRIDGSYMTHEHDVIEISGTSLKFYPSSILSPNQTNPSICSIKKVSNRLYEIIPSFSTNVLMDYTLSYRDMNPSLLNGAKESDSVTITFDIPYDKPLKINCSTLSNNYGFVYSRDNRTLRIPKDAFGGGFYISFAPVSISGEGLTGVYHGRVEAFLNCVLNGNPKTVIISIPGLDNAFFEDYQIESGFLLKKGKSLIWLGRSFRPIK